MKKLFMVILVGLLSFLGVNLTVNADTPPASFESYYLYSMPEYVPGIETKRKPIEGGYVICEDADLYYWQGFTYTLKGEVDDGYIYILEHSVNAEDSVQEYYIRAIATWWYKDYLTGKDTNLSQTQKNTILNSLETNSVSKEIYNLYTGAKSYKQAKGTITFTSSDINFKSDGDYYVSDSISIKSSSLKSFDGVKLNGAPTGTTIINSNVNSNGTGTFQVRVPKSSLTAGQTISFTLTAAGTYGVKKAYDYHYKDDFQDVIYGKVFTNPKDVSASKTLKVTKEVNKLTITKVDQNGKNLSGASLTLYKGDCTNSTCTNAYASWTTTSSAKEFTNVPVGKYTLVETKAPQGYKVAPKMLINVDSDVNTFKFTMTDELEISVRISKTDVTGQKEVPGATLILKDESGKQVDKWVSTSKPHYVVLEPGVYELSETIAPKGYKLTTTTINFKVDANGVIYEKNEAGKYVKVDYIKMINELEINVRISKTDVTGQQEIPGASLELKNEEGKVISSWISKEEPHYEILDPGVYELTETLAPKGYILNKTSVIFKIDAEGNIYEKNISGEFVKVDYVKMINLVKGDININKLDAETNEFVSGAHLVIKNAKGEIVAQWVSTEESYYLYLDEGDYVLTETEAPKGYILNNNSVEFRVDADGNLFIKDSDGNYKSANGVIMYNEIEEIEIPATGLNSVITYVTGTLVLAFGAIMLYRNEKKC